MWCVASFQRLDACKTASVTSTLRAWTDPSQRTRPRTAQRARHSATSVDSTGTVVCLLRRHLRGAAPTASCRFSRLWSLSCGVHSRIQIHQGKTQLWNEGGVPPPVWETLAAHAWRSDPDAVVWRGDRSLPEDQQGVKVLGTPLGSLSSCNLACWNFLHPTSVLTRFRLYLICSLRGCFYYSVRLRARITSSEFPEAT